MQITKVTYNEDNNLRGSTTTTTHDDNDLRRQRPTTTTTRNNNDLHQGPYTRTDPPLRFSCTETGQISATVVGGYVCSVGTTFVTSQCCMAVSVGTRIAIARFLVGFGSATRTRVSVPPGFLKTPTLTHMNPYPCARVRVFAGTGTGSSGIPQGYP